MEEESPRPAPSPLQSTLTSNEAFSGKVLRKEESDPVMEVRRILRTWRVKRKNLREHSRTGVEEEGAISESQHPTYKKRRKNKSLRLLSEQERFQKSQL